MLIYPHLLQSTLFPANNEDELLVFIQNAVHFSKNVRHVEALSGKIV